MSVVSVYARDTGQICMYSRDAILMNMGASHKASNTYASDSKKNNGSSSLSFGYLTLDATYLHQTMMNNLLVS